MGKGRKVQGSGETIGYRNETISYTLGRSNKNITEEENVLPVANYKQVAIFLGFCLGREKASFIVIELPDRISKFVRIIIYLELKFFFNSFMRILFSTSSF